MPGMAMSSVTRDHANVEAIWQNSLGQGHSLRRGEAAR